MTDFTPARLAELRGVAEAAFPDEDWAIWEDLTEGGFVHVGNARGVIPEGEIATPEDAEANPVAKAYTPEMGRHIATFDPPTVLALIAALEAVLEFTTSERDTIRTQYDMTGGIPADYRGYANACDDVIALIEDALEAKTAEVESRIEDRDWFKARAERAERERDEARADAETGAEMHARWQERAGKAEAALKRLQSTFFANHLYLTIVSNPALNNEIGEALYDRVLAMIRNATGRNEDA